MKRIARIVAPAALAVFSMGVQAAELTAADTAPVPASTKAFERVGPQPAYGAVAPGDIGLQPVGRASTAQVPPAGQAPTALPGGAETIVGA